NWAGAHPRVAARMAEASSGYAAAYGSSDLDKKVELRFAEIFEREVAVFFVATGTAANSLAMTSASRPGAVAFCHRDAHMVADECGAPEYLSGGTVRMLPVDGPIGRMDLGALRQSVARFNPGSVHGGRPTAVSITQATEVGTVYHLDEIAEIGDLCREKSLTLHMDGARFANALTSLDASPAEMTWKRGVDIVSFGGTKNGCWCAEAVILFDLDRAKDFGFARKRAAQLFSKSRFIAAQFDAYFEDGLWLDSARHANAMSTRLARAFGASNRARLAWEPEANEVFAIMARIDHARLSEAGARFYEWQPPLGFGGELGPDDRLYRFVTSFATTTEDVDRFADLLG
ncbi:MAG: low specificity L-threonine aldolase, partial [Rhizobiaceae bacterium]|nr:low specificity L-threonine aldolase [Rhizobiaceae bacterium]